MAPGNSISGRATEVTRGQHDRNPVGYHVAADDRIVAAWQNPRPGDIISDGPPGTACYVVRQAEPGRSFVLFIEISDSFLLTAPAPGTTRLLRRMRLTCSSWPFRLYAVPIVLIWGEVITARHPRGLPCLATGSSTTGCRCLPGRCLPLPPPEPDQS